MSAPRHVVIVPDGNRRWARKKGRPAFFGHQAGAKTAEEILKAAEKTPIECLTLWGCSVGNLTGRSPLEVGFLYKIFARMFKKLEKQRRFFDKKDIRVQVLGRWREFFPDEVRKIAERVTKDTQDHRSKTLTFLMAYDGRDEMLAAVQGLIRAGVKPQDVDRDKLKAHLWSKELPPVDLVIRTGGEPHWSAGMMMWDVAEARLYFTKTLWPDFKPKEFEKALKAYAGEERRYGK